MTKRKYRALSWVRTTFSVIVVTTAICIATLDWLGPARPQLKLDVSTLARLNALVTAQQSCGLLEDAV